MAAFSVVGENRLLLIHFSLEKSRVYFVDWPVQGRLPEADGPNGWRVGQTIPRRLGGPSPTPIF